MSGASALLRQRQRWLFERVTEPAAAFAAAADVETLVLGGSLRARERVAVYRHGYVARLVECLEDDYPALQHALGPEPFAGLCRDFVRQNPPRSPSLNFYGAPLAGHCASREEPWAPFAAELAALEWALVEAIHEAEGERLDAERLQLLAAEDWMRARLLPSPALRVLETRYPVGRYYQAYREGQALSRRFPALEPSALAVCRRGADVWRVSVEPALLPLLASLIAGTPLLAALDAATQPGQAPTVPPSPEAVQRAFRDWIACGLFSAVVLTPASGGATGPGEPFSPAGLSTTSTITER